MSARVAAAFASAAGGPFDATGQTPMNVLETMLDGLELKGSESVLCIGRGIGYPVALLSHLAHEVHAVEVDASLVEPQLLALAKLGRTNVSMIHADGLCGWGAAAPFQAILVVAGAPELPHALIGELAVGGRIVIPLGDEGGQLIEVLEKRVDALASRTLGRCSLPLLPSLQRTPSTFPWK